MTTLFNKYIHFTNIALAIIILVEVLVNFKKNNLLKLLFGCIVIMIATINSFNFINHFEIWHHSAIILLKFLLGFSLLFLLCYLYLIKLMRYLGYYFILCIILYLFQMHFDNSNLALNKSLELYQVIFIANTDPPSWFIMIRKFISLSLFSFNLILLFNIFKKIKEKNIYNLKIKNWIIALTFLLLLIFTNFIIQRVLNISNPVIQDFSFAIISLFSLLCILFRPQFLNYIHFSKISLFSLSKTENEMNNTIYNEFILLQYFRKKDASFMNLKKQLDITENDLTNFINSNTKLDFNDYINKHRVEFFLEIVKDEQYKNYTINALAQEVGFSSRHHLYKPFKKFHGGTPSDYINSLNN